MSRLAPPTNGWRCRYPETKQEIDLATQAWMFEPQTDVEYGVETTGHQISHYQSIGKPI